MKVLLFARARDLIGADLVEIAMSPFAKVADLRRALIERYPNLTSLIEKSAIAVNDEFAAEDAAIPDHAEVALLPPVSGG
jgi:molybdopterin converting factor subunit 1